MERDWAFRDLNLQCVSECDILHLEALAQSVDDVEALHRCNDLTIEGLADGRIAGFRRQFVHDEGLNTLAGVGQAVRRIDRRWIRDLSPVFHHANAGLDRGEVVELADDGDRIPPRPTPCTSGSVP